MIFGFSEYYFRLKNESCKNDKDSCCIQVRSENNILNQQHNYYISARCFKEVEKRFEDATSSVANKVIIIVK